jgi:glucokinase
VRSALVGDVGGTRARFARLDADGRPGRTVALTCDEHSGFAALLAAALARLGAGGGVERSRTAAVAIAGPIAGDSGEVTNLGWRFSTEATRRSLGLDRLLLLNDLEALALGLPELRGEDFEVLRAGEAVADAPRALIGAGTGLGVSGLIPVAGDWLALRGEGGHRDLAANDEREWRVVERLAARFGRASAERALSGPGLVALYEALAEIDGVPIGARSPERITAGALDGSDRNAVEALHLFCGWLGAVAGDLVLTLGARGGLELAGGVLEGMGGAFDRERFLARFTAKGRFAAYLERVPVRRLREPAPPRPGAALRGAARALRRAGG